MAEKIKNVLSNIKSRALNGKSELVKTKEINKSINEAEIKKAELLLEIGKLTYEKIRSGELTDLDISDLSDEILELDKLIYNKNTDIEYTAITKEKSVCKCGHIIDINDKFCAECGSKIEIQEESTDYIVCNRCNCELEEDFNYCICCGNKMQK